MSRFDPPAMRPPVPEPPQAAAPHAPPQPSVAPARTSGLAIAAFVTSLVPFCMIHLVGLVLGIVAWTQIAARPQELKGKGFAIAAVSIGALWLVIAVIGIVAAIAIPSFLGYQVKSQQAEARSNLRALYEAEATYFAEHGRYADSFEALGWRPESASRYTLFLGDDAVAPAHADAQILPMDVGTYANRDRFQAAAAGNIDEDATVDVWVIGDDGQMDHVVDDSLQ